MVSRVQTRDESAIQSGELVKVVFDASCTSLSRFLPKLPFARFKYLDNSQIIISLFRARVPRYLLHK